MTITTHDPITHDADEACNGCTNTLAADPAPEAQWNHYCSSCHVAMTDRPRGVIVAGGRDFADKHLMAAALDHLLLPSRDDLFIVSGAAHGADSLAAAWARNRMLPCITMPARWEQLGKRAGYVRNEGMARLDRVEGLIAFWDGQSRGTSHMIDIARNAGHRVVVVNY